MAVLQNKTVFIIGAGPRIIGQSAECDEGALEAARTLAGQDCRIITVNSNPDAIITAPSWADRSYMEPLTVDSLSQIIAAEKPDALLPAFGGRQGLHLTARLAHSGILEQHGIALWGPSIQSVEQVLNRDTLNAALGQIGLKTPPIFVIQGMDAAIEKSQELGFPIVLRYANSNLIPDGVLIYNQDELMQYSQPGLGENGDSFSIEASLSSWQQVELEVLRDYNGKSVVAGCVEYVDTAEIHPGDAVAVCPPQTLSGEMLDLLGTHAARIVDHLNIVGGATIRFAHRPTAGDILVLAVHPRYTRTSALISRVMDIPLASLTGLLAAGCAFEALPSAYPAPEPWDPVTGVSRAACVGVKWPCWDFSRLSATTDRLGPQMQAVGQSVGYGIDFREALQKAARAATGNGFGVLHKFDYESLAQEDLLAELATPSSRRLNLVCEALRRGVANEELDVRTHIAPGFLDQLKGLVDLEARSAAHKGRMPAREVLQEAKAAGFSNEHLCGLLEVSCQSLERRLDADGILPGYRALSTRMDTLRFSSYGVTDDLPAVSNAKKVLIVGSGAYRIGQGAECDFGVHQAAEDLAASGYHPIVINCNLAGITTGRAMATPCYCDPVDIEEIRSILAREKPLGVITQFAGIHSDQLTHRLAEAGVNVLGASLQNLELVNDRNAFRKNMRQLGIPQPAGAIADSPEEVSRICSEIGYPVQIEPLNQGSVGGPELVQDATMLESYLDGSAATTGFPVLVEQFLEYAIEAQAETLCDGRSAHVAAVMEHIELAGVHAGDSACVLPPYSIGPRHIETMTEYCQKIASALEIKGLVNFRFAIYRDTVYLLDMGFNVCRNLAVVSRVQRLPLGAMAVRLILGADLNDLPLVVDRQTLIGVRAAVFSFNVFGCQDPLLGPRMRSIGQVSAMADTFAGAYFKSQEATGSPLPTKGTVLITVTDEDKASILEPARIFHELGFKIMATRGTHAALAANGIDAQLVRKLGYGRPNLLDEIKNGRVQMVINTPTGGQGQIDDSIIRKTAIVYRIANMTTPASALAAAKGIAAQRKGKYIVRPL